MAGENLEAILDRIEAAGQAREFSEEDRETLRHMIAVFRFLLNLGRLGRGLVWVLLTAAAAVTAFEQLIKHGGNP